LHLEPTNSAKTALKMGVAASFERKLDEEVVRGVAGDKFDQDLFDSLKDADGCITIDQFMSAAASENGNFDE